MHTLGPITTEQKGLEGGWVGGGVPTASSISLMCHLTLTLSSLTLTFYAGGTQRLCDAIAAVRQGLRLSRGLGPPLFLKI